MKHLLYLLIVLLPFGVSAQTSIKVYINASQLDAEEEGNVVETDDDELDLGWDGSDKGTIGFIFSGFPVEVGGTIDSAFIMMVCSEGRSGALEVIARTEPTPDPADFAASANNITNRTLGSDSVVWTIGDVDLDAEFRSPNLASIIQPVVDLPSYQLAKSVSVIIGPNVAMPGGSLEVEPYASEDTDAAHRPYLMLYADMINNVDEKDIKEQSFVYPNPAKDVLYFSSEALVDSWSVHDLSGRIVSAGINGGHADRIDLLELTPGAYSVVLRSRDGSSVSKKFVKL